MPNLSQVLKNAARRYSAVRFEQTPDQTNPRKRQSFAALDPLRLVACGWLTAADAMAHSESIRSPDRIVSFESTARWQQ
jgi:hypothetical protein